MGVATGRKDTSGRRFQARQGPSTLAERKASSGLPHPSAVLLSGRAKSMIEANLSRSSGPDHNSVEDSADMHISGINWVTSTFLISTLVVALITTPLYIWRLGIGPLEIILFLTMFVASGVSITAGYHRLFTHCTYRAPWPVRLVLVLFGAATFETSALNWSSDHRYHSDRQLPGQT